MKKLYYIAFCLIFCFIITINSVNSETNRKLIECNFHGKTIDVLWSGDEVRYENGTDYYYLDDDSEIIYEYPSNTPLKEISALLDKIIKHEYIYNQKGIVWILEGVRDGYLKNQEIVIDRTTGKYLKNQSTRSRTLFGWGAPSSYTQLEGYCKIVSNTQKF